MDIVAMKLLSAAFFLVVGLIGGFLPAKVSKLSPVAMHVAYAFAGGILAAVAVVHMLDDASGDLQDMGAHFAKALGGKDDAVFPMGNALFLIGFFFICSVEAFLHHKLGADAKYDHNGHSGGLDNNLLTAEVGDPRGTVTGGVDNAAGWATVVGLTIHSTVEGVAAGAVRDETQAAMVVLRSPGQAKICVLPVRRGSQ
eukprot:TRINITY_DN2550_c0_g1_i3.p1 TRINITY_DN2550_c0_g1~~TRINITY_DN2550_c0_g1_i3.p1  ORF type:complete len:225 (-),score=31.70 TRINITY_DN2550_c0_g1_i3:906-1499(-)